MEYKKFANDYVLRLDPGEEIIASIAQFAQETGVELASVQAIGACNQVEYGLYNLETQEYHLNTKEEDLELVSLIGNINTMDGEHYSHFHATFADQAGHVWGGHLNKAVISATGEFMIHTIQGNVDREKNLDTGINEFRFED